MRRITGSGRPLKPNSQKIVKDFLNEIQDTIKKHKLKDYQIFGFDQTSFYMDSTGFYTVAEKGS